MANQSAVAPLCGDFVCTAAEYINSDTAVLIFWFNADTDFTAEIVRTRKPSDDEPLADVWDILMAGEDNGEMYFTNHMEGKQFTLYYTEKSDEGCPLNARVYLDI